MVKIQKQKIIVAMSGGVDSSVAAALLKKQGYFVIGVFMKFWKDGKSGKNSCCSTESEKLARLVAKQIGIPFYVLNAEKEFKNKVVNYFLKEYKKGNTPNPCVVCNKDIKFGFLIRKALLLRADYIATGHYAKFEKGKLLKGKDDQKDQSYFLWQLTQKQLKHVLFPVGNYTKPEVRELAKELKLPTAKTPESQEVCFIQNTVNDFLTKYLKIRPGNIIDKNNKVLGQHKGLWFYTIGQRKGIEVPQGPYYVIKKDFQKNNLVVSKDKKDLLTKELIALDVNWINAEKLPLIVQAKIRYKSGLVIAKIFPFGKNKVRVVLNKAERAVTPGQSIVFYNKKELLGGGVILH